MLALLLGGAVVAGENPLLLTLVVVGCVLAAGALPLASWLDLPRSYCQVF